MSAANPYIDAYPVLRERRGVWREIARYVARDIADVGLVVEIGAGYCDFINAFPARRKIALDLNPKMAEYADPDVEFRTGDAVDLAGIEDESVDLLFASNVLEHLNAEELERLLPRIRSVLSKRGVLVLLQPNHKRCADHYFDDPTHVTIFDDENIRRWLARFSLRTVRVTPGLLPFSMKSRLPKWPVLIWSYLRSPFRPMAAQMYVVAERA